jgi:hypothetical protein
MFNAALAGSRKNRGGPTSSVAVMLLSYDSRPFLISFPRFNRRFRVGNKQSLQDDRYD